jgi:hypothetical protein
VTNTAQSYASNTEETKNDSTSGGVQLVSPPPSKFVNVTGQQLTREKTLQIKQELSDAINAVCNQHDLVISRLRAEQIDNGELNLTTRISTRNAHGFDSLQRDLLNFCGKYNFLPSIMNASIIIEDFEHVIDGIDVSVAPYMFRLKKVSDNKSVFASSSTIKSLLPSFFS